MKITFFSNFLTHHQIPFCNEMHNILKDSFKFVATEPIDVERLNMGYKDESHDYKYELNSYESVEIKNYCLKLCFESDVVIIGSAPEELRYCQMLWIGNFTHPPEHHYATASSTSSPSTNFLFSRTSSIN